VWRQPGGVIANGLSTNSLFLYRQKIALTPPASSATRLPTDLRSGRNKTMARRLRGPAAAARASSTARAAVCGVALRSVWCKCL